MEPSGISEPLLPQQPCETTHSLLQTRPSECRLADNTCFLNDGSNIPGRDQIQVKRKLVIACGLCFLFMLMEVVGGYLANSVAIMSDAAHMFSDMSAFAVSLFAAWVVTRKSHESYTFGYHRAEIVGALVSISIIWLVTGALVYEAILRTINPVPVDGKVMFIVAIGALLFNLALMLVVGHHHHHGGCSQSHSCSGGDHGHHQGHHSHAHGDGCGGHSHSHSHSHGTHQENISFSPAVKMRTRSGISSSLLSPAAAGPSGLQQVLVEEEDHEHNEHGCCHGHNQDHSHNHASHHHASTDDHNHSHCDHDHEHTADEHNHEDHCPGHKHSHEPERHSPFQQGHSGHSCSHGDRPAHQPKDAHTGDSVSAAKASCGHTHKHATCTEHSHADSEPHVDDDHASGSSHDGHSHGGCDHDHGHTHGGHEHEHANNIPASNKVLAAGCQCAVITLDGSGFAATQFSCQCVEHGGDHEACLRLGKELAAELAKRRSKQQMMSKAAPVIPSEGHLGLRSAAVHILGDMIQSIGVALAGALIWWNQGDPRWYYADPICTYLFSIMVLLTTREVMKDVIDTLMERTPVRYNLKNVSEAMGMLDGIHDVHDLHIWNLSMGLPILTAHVHISSDACPEDVLNSLERYVGGLGITHSTIQICNIPPPTLTNGANTKI